MSAFSDFILEHQDDDTDRLLFSKERFPEMDIHKAVNTILCRRKLKSKLPSWYSCPGLVYPERIAAEQCSSEITAEYKAGLASRLIAERHGKGKEETDRQENEKYGRIADLTGGMGVDSWAFSKIADKVLYNEMNPVLSEAATHNFQKLNIQNISVFDKNISVTSNDGGTSPAELLKGFAPDMIFLDPARRAKDGRKVFLIKDCSPDVLTLKDELLELSPVVMIKLSPMADISMVAERLGEHCREIHVVSAEGECKELLVIMDREWSGGYTVTAIENVRSGATFTFTRKEEEDCPVNLLKTFPEHFQEARHSALDAESPALYLFEPGKSMMKAGAFNLLCSRFGIRKFGRSTHFYVTEDKETAERLLSFGKIFEITAIYPFNNRTVKTVGAEYPYADVTARNLPVSSDELTRKLRSGNRKQVQGEAMNEARSSAGTKDLVHIFALKSDILGNLLVIAGPLRAHDTKCPD